MNYRIHTILGWLTFVFNHTSWTVNGHLMQLLLLTVVRCPPDHCIRECHDSLCELVCAAHPPPLPIRHNLGAPVCAHGFLFFPLLLFCSNWPSTIFHHKQRHTHRSFTFSRQRRHTVLLCFRVCSFLFYLHKKL
jgi:hypothetical protein